MKAPHAITLFFAILTVVFLACSSSQPVASPDRTKPVQVKIIIKDNLTIAYEYRGNKWVEVGRKVTQPTNGQTIGSPVIIISKP